MRGNSVVEEDCEDGAEVGGCGEETGARGVELGCVIFERRTIDMLAGRQLVSFVGALVCSCEAGAHRGGECEGCRG